MSNEKHSGGSLLFGVVVLGLIGWGIYSGVTYAAEKLKTQPSVNAAAPDPRDEQIKELSEKVATLEAKPKAEHHYELRNDGLRTFRFDPETGETCIQLTTKQDWKRPETIRQGCQYQDWVNASGATGRDTLSAECLLVNVKTACDQLIK